MPRARSAAIIPERTSPVPALANQAGAGGADEYDGIKLAQLFTPRLTTYRQNVSAMGQEAARMLREAIEAPDSFLPRYVTIPGQLVAGESIREL